MIDKKRPLKSRGFTLMELIVVAGIIGILVIIAGSALVAIQSTYFKAAFRLDNEIEEALGQRAVWLNLLNSGPSYNNVNQADDNGRQFFDLFPDVPRKDFSAADYTRVKTLSVAGDSIYFLLFDREAAPTVYYDVARAYEIDPGATVADNGNLQFAGVNSDGYLDGLNPSIWKPDNMLLLYSPISLRPPAAPLTTAPRFSIFTGRVTGGGLTPDTAGGIIRNTHPVTGAVIGTADEFFRTSPPVGGGAPFVLVAGVTLIQYRMVADSYYATGKFLQRREWHGGWNMDYPIALNLRSVTFRRNSVIIPTINVDMLF